MTSLELEMTMTVNTAYELQKSRGMRNRNHLIRQKEIDLASREKKELARQRKLAKKEKILRELLFMLFGSRRTFTSHYFISL